MSIEIDAVADDRWDDLVRSSGVGTPFHLAAATEVVAEHGDVGVHRLVGFKGEEPVGLFPVFTKRLGPVTAAFSPPPNLKIPYLGPLFVNVDKLKRRRRDRRKTRFVEAAVDWLRSTHDPAFTNVRTTPGYDDVRPFLWQSFTATPRYTYLVDLERDPDDLLAAFSTDARRNITGEYDVEFTLGTDGAVTIDHIVTQVSTRHAEQGEAFPVDAAFVTDLADALPDGVLRTYYCTVEGEYAGGTINLEFDGGASTWIGGAKPDHDLPVNDLLEWYFIRDAMSRDVKHYDLSGANNRRLSRYKSKFAPELETYYSLENGTWTARRLARLYGKYV